MDRESRQGRLNLGRLGLPPNAEVLDRDRRGRLSRPCGTRVALCPTFPSDESLGYCHAVLPDGQRTGTGRGRRRGKQVLFSGMTWFQVRVALRKPPGPSAAAANR